MAGHSQFKNIMHRKGRVDAVRSKLFSKLAREITVAAKLGTPDRPMNPRLRAAVLAARAENMPKDNIERAIKKATGGEGENYEEIRYEGYGPGGAALIVEAQTDNRKPHRQRRAFGLHQVRRQPRRDRCVAFMFEVGVIAFAPDVADADTMLGSRHRGGADDVRSDADGHEVTCAQDAYGEVSKALEARFGEPRRTGLIWKAQNTVDVDDETGEKLIRLVEVIEDQDDVQNVYVNFALSEALMEKMSA